MPSPSALRRVLAAYALYGIVELAVWVAVVLFAYDRGGPSLAAFASVVQLLPAAVLAAPLTGLAERLPRGVALAAAHAAVAVAAGLTTTAIATQAPVPLILGTSALVTAAVALVRPLHFAVLPRLAPDPHALVSANAVSSVADGVALFAGPALAGGVTAWSGPWLVFAGAAAASGVAALLCLRLPGTAVPGASADQGSLRTAVRGLRALRRDVGAVALMVVLSTDWLVAGALDVLAVAYCEQVLGAGAAGAGVLIGGIGVGALAGAVLGGRWARRRRLAPVVVGGGVLQGVAIALTAGAGSLAGAFVAVAFAGTGGAMLTVAGRTLYQRAVDDDLLACVLAVQEGVSMLALAAGAAVAPALVVVFSPGGAFVPLGLVAVALTLGAAVLVRRLDGRTARHRAVARVDLTRAGPAPVTAER